jgi:hypothetical protein
MNSLTTFLLCTSLFASPFLSASENPDQSKKTCEEGFEDVQVPSYELDFTLETNIDEALKHYDFSSKILGISISGAGPTRIMKEEALKKTIGSSIEFNSFQSPVVSLDIYKAMFPNWKLLETFNMEVKSIDTGEKSDPQGRKIVVTIQDNVTQLQKIASAAYFATKAVKDIASKALSSEE